MFTCSVVSYPKTDRKPWTFVPPLEQKPVVFKTNPFSNSDADDEDDNDFEAMAGKFLLLLVL